jgi:hypothetical protein
MAVVDMPVGALQVANVLNTVDELNADEPKEQTV